MSFLRGFAEIPAYRHLSDVHTSGIKKSLSKGKVIFYFCPAHTTNFRFLGPSFVTQWYYHSFSCKIFFLRSPAEIHAYRHLSDVRTSGVKKSLSKGKVNFYFFSSTHNKFQASRTNFRLSSLKGFNEEKSHPETLLWKFWIELTPSFDIPRFKGRFFDFFYVMYITQHCFICLLPSDSTVSGPGGC